MSVRRGPAVRLELTGQRVATVLVSVGDPDGVVAGLRERTPVAR